MAKRTAIIDLGTNGIRIAIYERTSRYGFYIVNEQKLKIRLSEGAYKKDGFLQDKAMEKTINTLAYLKQYAQTYKCKKILCVATSALRDAPNAKYFIKEVFKKIKISIKCLSGEEESFLGGFAALNLLSQIKLATTIDIGGGSCELCLIKDNKIQDTISLNLGTVRLKELYDIKKDEKQISDLLSEQLKNIPEHFKNENIILIGGSLRALSNAIISKNSYPHNKVHGFSYNLDNEKKFLQSILKSDELGKFGIKKERHDTIKYGTMIFLKLIKYLNATTAITSGVGVREGILLKDILRGFFKMPKDTNPSLRSLLDRFEVINIKKTPIYAKQLFEILKPHHNLDEKYINTLTTAAKIAFLGIKTSYYSKHNHAGYLALNGLNFQYTHKKKVLIYTILSLHGKKFQGNKFKDLLPKESVISWLNYILALSVLLSKDGMDEKLEFELIDDKLIVKNKSYSMFLKEEYKKIYCPEPIELIFWNT